MYRVMIRDNMSSLAAEILEGTGKIKVVVDNDKKTGEPEALAAIIGDFDGLAIRSGTKVDAHVIENAKRLKVIGRAGIGVDNVDCHKATQKGVVVMNAPGGNTVTTAEHTISLMMSLARNVPQATAFLREGKWEKKKLIGVEITGKSLGIIGLGNIGRVVAQRAAGLKMRVLASDPFIRKEAADSLGVELVSFDELLARSDFITIHVPRLKETINMINRTTISQMKKGVRIINCSRGENVNLNDLYEAVEEGHVAGAALDVFPDEPPDPGLPLLQHPRIIFTPHLGASTLEAQTNVAKMIAEQMADYLIHGSITNAVNFPSVSPELMEKLRPHLRLAEKMGSIMGQMSVTVHDVSIHYSGELAEVDTRPITHAILKGMMGAYTDAPINYVNAPELARRRGIKVHDTIDRALPDFSNLVKIILDGREDGPSEIWGTIFAGKHQRIVKMGSIYMDVIPEGSMIIIQNRDKPGVIGNVGTLLGKHDINIGRFQLGRRDDRAFCMVNIDTPAGEDVIEELEKLPNIISVKQVHLEKEL
jgi:D-3-phosphoglycerate dehydrogenase